MLILKKHNISIFARLSVIPLNFCRGVDFTLSKLLDSPRLRREREKK